MHNVLNLFLCSSVSVRSSVTRSEIDLEACATLKEKETEKESTGAK